ncbi:MAG: PKD domain-containing protein, partial [Bacteroidota bacterium]
NGAGSDTLTLEDYLLIQPVPIADFAFTITGNTVDFDNTSLNGITYEWIFGDGTVSMDFSPSHVYTEPGSYVVTLNVTSNCGVVSFSQLIEIIAAPSAAFTANVTSGCRPLTVQFQDQSQPSVAAWSWIFAGGDPTNSNLANPVVVYQTAGDYPVELTVSNAGGEDELVLLDYISVEETPEVDFSFTVNGNTVNFNNLSSGATSYQWVFGDGATSGEFAPNHIYTTPGTYVVTLSASNACGMTEQAQILEILAAPTASFTADVLSGCEPLTVQFQDQSLATVTSWNWSFPGGSPSNSTLANPQVVYTAAGTYPVSLEVSNATGSDQLFLNNYINVEAGPTANFSLSLTGNMLTTNNLSTGASTYFWEFGDGTTSTQASPSHNFSSGGTYTVTLTASNNCGSETSQQTVVVEEQLAVAFTANFTEACAPFVFNFSDLSSSSVNSWNWSFPGGNPASSTEQEPTVVYSTPGTYPVSLEVSDGLQTGSVTLTDYLTLLPKPSASFDYTVDGITVSFNNTSSNGLTYEWDFGDGSPVSTTPNPTYTYDNQGVYTVSLFVSNGLCGAFVSEIVDVNSTSVHQLVDGKEVQFFPNPVAEYFYIQFSEAPITPVWGQLMGIDGRVYQSIQLSGDRTTQLDFRILPAGIYLLRLWYQDQWLVEKIIKH